MDNQGELFSFWDSYQNIPDAFKIIESGIDSLIHKNSEQLALPPTLNFKITHSEKTNTTVRCSRNRQWSIQQNRTW